MERLKAKRLRREDKMGKLLVKNKDLVVPGEVLVEGMDYVPGSGVFREGEMIVANSVGLVSVDNRLVKLIPLTGFYAPKKNDTVIGKVANINFNGWMIDIGHSNFAMLSLKEATNEYIDKKADLSKYYDFGDVVVAKIISTTKDGTSDLTMKGPGLNKLVNGRVIEVASTKVPRIIGKQGSMITIIKTKTNCKVVVGQNGKVWIQSENPEEERKAIDIIRFIEKESVKEGLTEKVEKLLK